MNTVDELTLKEIIKIVAEYKEALAEAGSEHERRHCESVAFHAVLGAIEWNQKQKEQAQVIVAKPLTEEEKKKLSEMWCKTTVSWTAGESDADEAVKESHYLDDGDDTIAGRAHE